MMPPVFSSSARTGAIPAASMAGLMAFSYTRLKSMFGRPVGSGLLPNGMRTKQSGCGMTTTSVHLSKRQPQYEARALILLRIHPHVSAVVHNRLPRKRQTQTHACLFSSRCERLKEVRREYRRDSRAGIFYSHYDD